MSSRASNAQESKKVAMMSFTNSQSQTWHSTMPYSIGHPEQHWYNVCMGVREGGII